MTNVTAGSGENVTYTYPTGTNNGKVSSMYNAVSGETVTYTYDSLNRLLTASGSGWGQQYGFDPFGNLTSKTMTSGSGPSLSVTVNPANNQIQGVSGLSYDANGNTVSSGITYDAENRMIAGGAYAYDAKNKRIWITGGQVDGLGNATAYTVNVYEAGGQKLGAYQIAPYTQNGIGVLNVTLSSSDQYFGGRRLAVMDQLGSAGTYYPWGEDKGSTNPQNTWSYATYWRDSGTNLDYANNRYYSNAYGRFMTPDPYKGRSGGPGDPNNPQSWNRYAYVVGDPVNLIDPRGQWYQPPAPEQPFPGDPGGGGDCPPGWSENGEGGCIAPGEHPVQAPPQKPPPPRVISLREIDDCIFPNGTGITGGAWVLEVEYQVLVNGQPILGNYSLGSAGISQVNETVTTTSGGPIYGNGVWCLSSGNCAAPGSLTASGAFWDVLSGNGSANQSFTINGQTIAVNFPGAVPLAVLKNVYNSPGHSISVGGGALNGNSATRQCGTKNGDPSTN